MSERPSGQHHGSRFACLQLKRLKIDQQIAVADLITGSDAENAVRGHALAGTLADYELSFESGARMQGRFLVSRLDYAGDYNGERSYTLALESSGPVVQL